MHIKTTSDDENREQKENLEQLLPRNIESSPEFSQTIKEYDKDSSTTYNDSERFTRKFKFKYHYWYVIFLTINAATANFLIGWNIGVFDPIQSHLINMFGWDDKEKRIYLSLISSSLQLGAIFGSLFSGTISRKLGRRKTFLYANIISWVGIAFTLILNEYFMIFGRLISGVCVGIMSPLVCIYVNEFVPYEVSGLCGAIYETCFCLGIFLCYLAGLNLPDENEPSNQWWRIMVAIPAFLNTVNMLCLLFIFKYEPPKYLFLNKNNIEAAKQSLRSIYKREEDVEEIIKDLTKLEATRSPETGFKQICSKKYRHRLFIACFLMVGQLVGGADVIFMYSEHIYLHILGDKKAATFYTILTGLSMVLSGLSSIIIIEKFGRRKLLLLGQTFLIMTLFCISLLYYIDYVTIVIIYLFILFIFLNGVSISPICYIYSSDVLPENGVSLAVMSNYITDFILCTSFLFLEKSFLKMCGTIGLYCALSITIFLLSIRYVKETQNLTGKQIDDLFKS